MQTANNELANQAPTPLTDQEQSLPVSMPPLHAELAHQGEVFLHVLFLVMSTAVIGLAFWLNYEDKSGVSVPGMSQSLPPLCTSRMLLGMDCPGCGLTRSFIAISDGRFAKAWELNRVSFLVYAFVVAQIPWHSIQLIRIYRGKPPMFWSIIYMIPMALAITLVVNWMFKVVGW